MTVPRPFVALLVIAPLVALRAQATTWQPAPGHVQMPIWPGAVPNARPAAGPETVKITKSDELVAGKPWTYIENVTRPTFTVYTPKGNNTGAAVVVFPGGGYQILAIDLEGTEVCDWLTSNGITCVLLKYRVPRSGPSWQRDCHCRINPKPQPALQDAQRTMGTHSSPRRRISHRSSQARRARLLGWWTPRRGDQ